MNLKEYKKLSDSEREKAFPLDKQSTSVVSVTLKRLNKIGIGTHVILPDNLNIDELIANYPPENFGFDSKYNFDPTKVYLILGLLSSIPTRNKDLIVKDNYIPIKAEILNGFMTDYNSYLEYLRKAGVIEWRHEGAYWHGKTGSHSRRYRWTEQYLKAEKFIRVAIPEFIPKNERERISQIEQIRDYNERNLANIPEYLTHWYKENKIQIDYDRASDYAVALRDYRKIYPDKKGWNADTMKMEYKSPEIQYIASLNNLDALDIGNYRVSISPKVHRLYSVITSIESEFRNLLTYDGQKMVGIDIRSTQPYLLCLLLKKEFWMNNSPLPIHIKNLPQNIQVLFSTPPEILSNIRVFIESTNEADFQEYISLVATDIYNAIVNWDKQKNPTSKITRDIAKNELLVFFNDSNKEDEDAERTPRRIHRVERFFSVKFPRVMELINLIKMDYEGTEGYKRFSYLLQTIESKIILHRVCKRIWEEKPAQVPIFTIHDCIATTIENEEYVKNIMDEELTRAIGISPRLKREVWDESELPNLSESQSTSNRAELDRVNAELEGMR